MPANIKSILQDVYEAHKNQLLIATSEDSRVQSQQVSSTPLRWLSLVLSQPVPMWTRSEQFVTTVKPVVRIISIYLDEYIFYGLHPAAVMAWSTLFKERKGRSWT
jgi:hypothetical protein